MKLVLERLKEVLDLLPNESREYTSSDMIEHRSAIRKLEMIIEDIEDGIKQAEVDNVRE